MADTTKELLTLEPGTPCRVLGVVKQVYDIATGESKHGTWYRQDFLLQDDEGEIKCGWFNPGPTETMTILHGAEVQVMGEVNRYTTKNKEARTAIKASGAAAVKPVDGSEFSREASKPPASGQQSRPPSSNRGAMTDREWMAWAGGILPQLVDLYENGSEGDVTGEAVIEAAQATLVHLSIRNEKGSMQLTYGMLAEEEKAEEPEKEGGENVPDDEDVPFAWFLPFLVGGVLPWLA